MKKCANCHNAIYQGTFNENPTGYKDHREGDKGDPVWRHSNGSTICYIGWAQPSDMPEIVVLCGSTKFKDEFEKAEKSFGLRGFIVLTVALFGHMGDLLPEQVEKGHPIKDALDELHKRKIDLADYVFVLNVGGYIGDSTRSEIEYAHKIGRPVDYLEVEVGADAI